MLKLWLGLLSIVSQGSLASFRASGFSLILLTSSTLSEKFEFCLFSIIKFSNTLIHFH